MNGVRIDGETIAGDDGVGVSDRRFELAGQEQADVPDHQFVNRCLRHVSTAVISFVYK